MSGTEIVESIETMRNGETRVIDLKCGSVMKVYRGITGFNLLIIDPMRFAHADFCGDYNGRTVEQMESEEVCFGDSTANRLYLYIDEEAIPTLRALLCGMQRNVRQ
jgi:hypothetical protein